MKKLLMVFTFGLLSFNAFAQDRWATLGLGTDGGVVYYDKKTLTPTTVWTKTEYPKTQSSVQNKYKYTCKPRLLGAIQQVDSIQGIFNKNFTVPYNKVLMSDVPPDSVGEGLLDMLCKR